jgi:UDP-2,3-diacylglucosamine pyrophosphatase LpxH
VPIAGNHDKELQVVPAARKIFYEQCLGLTAEGISPRYRQWVAQQMGSPPEDAYPLLPFYVADPGLRMLATHGQWRDGDNARATKGWKAGDGWQPAAWREEQYQAFSEPCFGDTVAAGMLSHFIWCAGQKVNPDLKGASRIRNLLDEMDLYRPSVSAVVRLLQESRRLALRFPEAAGLHDTVLGCFRDSMRSWLGHKETWDTAGGTTWLGLHVLNTFSRLRWYWLDMALMRLMARMQEPEQDISEKKLMALPAFQRAYRLLGLRLHVEGHTHVALAADLQFPRPRQGRNNYTYVNLGAWRDAIIPKRNRGFRRRGVGRALFIFDFGRLAVVRSPDAYRFHIRDVTSWGDRHDMW